MILLIDNYDSFSYNLYQLIGSLDPDIRVIRHDELTPEQIIDLIANGVKHIHVYTMNDPEVAAGIQNNLSEIIG